LNWCRRCILPDTRPHLRIGPDGVCNACVAHAGKAAIDWDARYRRLQAVAAAARAQVKNGYDCLIPVSGGKDSTWQTVKCLELGLKPLAVTWKPPGRTEVGRRNLENLIALGVDHIDYAISPEVERRFMLETFARCGSTAIPMHLALFNIPLMLAVRLRIPLVVWGENSAFEYGSADEADTGFRLDARWLATYGVTQGTTAADWVSERLPARDLTAYFGPTEEELTAAGVRAIFLGYYLRWDPDETRRVALQHGFRSDPAGPRTGYYAFADIDDDFISLHHWMKWYKFGFTRLFDNLSLEIRNERMCRDDALTIVRSAGDQTPWADIERFCRFANIGQSRFLAIAERFRNPKIWSKRADGCWHIPGFLLADWDWGPV
jgi:N-acetyl sugar amidotransferase